MAKKPSTSILGSLKKMLGSSDKPSETAPKKSSPSTRKKAVAPAAEKRAPSGEAAKEPTPAPSAGTASAQEADPQAKPDRKKLPNQPWYRHRQRW